MGARSRASATRGTEMRSTARVSGTVIWQEVVECLRTIRFVTQSPAVYVTAVAIE